MEQTVKDAIAKSIEEGLQRLVLSNAPKNAELSKVKVHPVVIGKKQQYQVEEYRGTQVFHANCDETGVETKVLSWLEAGCFKQAELLSVFEQRTILIGKKGTATVKCRKRQDGVGVVMPREHNRKKQYLLEEGVAVPFLVDLGVMTKEGTVVKAKYDKFRQINRFLEFVEDILPSLPKNREVTILDFGCGKSYLTFALYHYLHTVKNYDIRIVGLDLKKDVIAHCNRLAVFYGYEKLEFLCGDIADYTGMDRVDMVVTLHACDTATDYALYKSILWKASVVLSVPCCQHEWNRQMECEPLAPFVKYGIVKERMSALMTDAFRANVMEACGYKTQLLEFIDMEHTPKNILLRAVKKEALEPEQQKERVERDMREILDYCKTEPTLYRLLTENK
ncbi:MAG: SAM-dependent methyltransferase [Lachnospiraceae bacterium]|nr:SAM-dependent methyltransferase [Lachnospiraceae bacterium]